MLAARDTEHQSKLAERMRQNRVSLSSFIHQVFHLNFSVLLDGTTALRPVLDQWSAEWGVARLLREVGHQQPPFGRNGMDGGTWMGFLVVPSSTVMILPLLVPTIDALPIPPPLLSPFRQLSAL